MKKTVSVLIVFIFLTACGCGNTKVIDDIKYDTYGIANQTDKKNPDIEYRIIVGNVVWSCILVETIIAPIYFICFSLYEPVGKADKNKPKGAI